MESFMISLAKLLATDDDLNSAYYSLPNDQEKYKLLKSKYNNLTFEEFLAFSKKLKEAENKIAQMSENDLQNVSGGKGSFATKLTAAAFLLASISSMGFISQTNASPEMFYNIDFTTLNKLAIKSIDSPDVKANKIKKLEDIKSQLKSQLDEYKSSLGICKSMKIPAPGIKKIKKDIEKVIKSIDINFSVFATNIFNAAVISPEKFTVDKSDGTISTCNDYTLCFNFLIKCVEKLKGGPINKDDFWVTDDEYNRILGIQFATAMLDYSKTHSGKSITNGDSLNVTIKPNKELHDVVPSLTEGLSTEIDINVPEERLRHILVGDKKGTRGDKLPAGHSKYTTNGMQEIARKRTEKFDAFSPDGELKKLYKACTGYDSSESKISEKARVGGDKEITYVSHLTESQAKGTFPDDWGWAEIKDAIVNILSKEASPSPTKIENKSTTAQDKVVATFEGTHNGVKIQIFIDLNKNELVTCYPIE